MEQSLTEMDRKADEVIKKWTAGAFAANLLPPPFDAVAVAATFAGMGRQIAQAYGVEISPHELMLLGKAVAKGVGAVTLGGHVGTSLLKWIPGMNIWVALLIQPPLVAYIANSAGDAFKKYFHFKVLGEAGLTLEEMTQLAATELQARLA